MKIGPSKTQKHTERGGGKRFVHNLRWMGQNKEGGDRNEGCTIAIWKRTGGQTCTELVTDHT